jgi:serpin B
MLNHTTPARRSLTWLGTALVVAVSVACSSAQPATSSPSPAPTPRPTPSPSPTPTASPSPSAAPAAIELAMADVPRAAGSEADAQAAADAINAFAFDLHRHLVAGDKGLVFSPTSIAIALGMARTGAVGATGTEMDAVLHAVPAGDYAKLLNSLDQALGERSGTFQDDDGKTHEISLDIANAYFAQRGLTFEDPFLEGLAEDFGAGMQLVDYETDPGAARELINAWASEQTRGRIPEVLQPPDVTTATRLALVNAIYLKAPWYRPFMEDRTTTEAFTRPDGDAVQVPMMHAGMGTSCATGPGWGAFELPYIGRELAMLVIVPDDIRAFEASLQPATIEAIEKAMDESVAVPQVSLPRFAFETRQELGTVLGALGMPRALDPELADFSAMTTEERLFIGKVIHQANISVDEKGTEAAAVTVVGMDTGGGPPDNCIVSANRSFLFAIRDTETGAILFLGRITDPSETS